VNGRTGICLTVVAMFEMRVSFAQVGWRLGNRHRILLLLELRPIRLAAGDRGFERAVARADRRGLATHATTPAPARVVS